MEKTQARSSRFPLPLFTLWIAPGQVFVMGSEINRRPVGSATLCYRRRSPSAPSWNSRLVDSRLAETFCSQAENVFYYVLFDLYTFTFYLCTVLLPLYIIFVLYTYIHCLIGDRGRLQHLRFCLFEMYVNVVFVIRCLYRAVSLTLVREQRFIRIIILILIIISSSSSSSSSNTLLNMLP